MYDRENVEKVARAFEEKRRQAEKDAVQRRNHAEEVLPELKVLNQAMQEIGLKIFSEAVKGGDDLEKRIEMLKEENIHLRKMQEEMLVKAGFPADYLKVRRNCTLCDDSGFVGSEICSCMKKEIVMESYRTSGLGKLLERQRFDNFDLSYYSDTPVSGRRKTDREAMREIYENCRKWAENFSPSESASFLFIGGTGLGKTHLSSAMAKTVIDKGFDVIYESAPNVVSVFEKERFSKEEADSRIRRYFDADLLILDDLGTEPSGKNTASIMYQLINTRASVTMKPTVISTNFTSRQLEQKYDSPIISRLFGEFVVMPFRGSDIRRAKFS